MGANTENTHILNTELIKDMFMNRDKDKDLKNKIENCIRKKGNADILILYLAFLFPDINLKHKIPTFLLPLGEEYKILSFLIEQHLAIKIDIKTYEKGREKLRKGRGNVESAEPEVKRAKIPKKEGELHKLFNLLVMFEKTLHNLVEADGEFFCELFRKMEDDEQVCILGTHQPSPILMAVHTNCRNSTDFYKFIELENRELKSAISLATPLDHKKIRKTLLLSDFPEIREKIGFFYKIFPECTIAFGRVSPQRSVYLENPLSLPLKSSVLSTYIPIICEINNYPHAEQLNIKMVYTRKILKRYTPSLAKKVLGEWLKDSAEYFSAFVSEAVPENMDCISRLSRDLLTLSNNLPEIIFIAKELGSRDIFMFAKHIVDEHRTMKNVRLLEENISNFDDSVALEYKKYFDISAAYQ